MALVRRVTAYSALAWMSASPRNVKSNGIQERALYPPPGMFTIPTAVARCTAGSIRKMILQQLVNELPTAPLKPTTVLGIRTVTMANTRGHNFKVIGGRYKGDVRENSKTSAKGYEIAEDGAAKHTSNTKQDTGDASGSTMEAKVKQGDAKEDTGDASAISGSTGDPEVKHGDVEGSDAVENRGDAQGNQGDTSVSNGERKNAGDTKDQCGKQHKKTEAARSASSSSSSSSESEGEGKTGCMERKKKVKKGKADRVKGGSERDSNKTKAENCIC